ncbi:hypothetical protein TheveDRAFT_1771 [Thermanaerovibrio velox DSM 12556]|uniref:AsmA-like C-terminal domain-containing protein n=1 Tax=Thermanaerovibrio velox DSM 12556 TaxID=926567 RepID=H0UR52_9BACT|nr:hypothetical protein [Thermanaerovibrio velox]EHM10889.1 hypothetical protein TheveDRAFT_1771 [Thermanaerovibrio velox DSM 12556]
MRGIKVLAVLVGAFAAIALATVPLATVLRNSDLYSRNVQDALSKGIKDSIGGSMEAGSFSGNPFVGYDAADLVIRDPEGRIVLRARNVRLSLSLLDLLRGRPRLSTVQFYSLEGDLDVMRSLKPKGKSGERMPFDEIRVKDGVITTSRGVITLETGRIQFPDEGYRFSLDGTFAGAPLFARGELWNPKAPKNELSLRLKLADGELELKGAGGDQLELTGSLKGMEIRRLRDLLGALGRRYHWMDSLEGRVWTVFDLKGTPSALVADGKGRGEELNINGYLIKSLRGSWTLSQGKLAFIVDRGEINGTTLSGRVYLDVGANWSLRLRLSGGPFRLESWDDTFPWLEGSRGVMERVSTDLVYSAHRLSGTVDAVGASVQVAGEDLKDLHIKAVLSQSGTGLEGSASWMGVKASFSGAVTGKGLSIRGPFRGLDLRALKDRFPDLGRLDPKGVLNGSFKLTYSKGEGLGVGLSSSGGALEISLGGKRLKMDRVSMDGAFLSSKGLLRVSGLSFGLMGGRFSLAGSIADLLGRGEVTAQGSFSGVPAKHFLGDRASGALSGTFSVRGTKGAPVVSFDASGAVSFRGIDVRDLRVTGVSPGAGRVDNLEVRGTAFGTRVLMRGAVRDGAVELSGSVPSVSLEALSPMLDMASKLKGALSLGLRVSGGGDAFQALVRVSGRSISAYGLPLKDVAGEVRISPSGWEVPAMTGGALGGRFNLSGSSRGGEVRLRGAIHDVSVGALGSPLEGLARGRFSGEVTLGYGSGEGEEAVTLKGRTDGLTFSGVYLGVVEISAHGGRDGVVIDSASASIGGGRISAKGRVGMDGDVPSLALSVRGKGLEVSDLLGKIRFGGAPLSGQVDISAEISYRKGLSGGGVMAFSPLVVKGLKLDQLTLPFYYGSGYLVVEDGRGSAYGGSVRLQFSREMASTKYGGNLSVEDFDLSKVWDDLYPGKKLKGSGRGSLTLSLQGDVNRTSTKRGRGKLSLRDGGFWGFEPPMESAMGAKKVSFKEVGISYELEGADLFLLPGSRISAPPGDRLYRYMMFDGSVLGSGALNLNCYGNLNSRGLNAVTGVIGGVISSGLNTQSLLRNVLSGAIGGWASGQFRDVSFQVRGTVSNPTVSNLKVYSPNRPRETGPSGGTKKEEREIRLNIEVPTGGSSGDNVGGQLQEQIIDNLLNIFVPKGQDQEE